MKMTRSHTLEERAMPARWSRGVVLELERALEVAKLRIERYEVTGDPGAVIEALELLEREMKRATPAVAAVRDLCRPGDGGELSLDVFPDGTRMPPAVETVPQAQTSRAVDRSANAGGRIEALAEHASQTVGHLEGAVEQAKMLTGAFVRLGIRDPLLFAMEQLERHALEAAGRAGDLKRILEATDTADWEPRTLGGGDTERATEGPSRDARATSSPAVRENVDPDLDLGS